MKRLLTILCLLISHAASAATLPVINGTGTVVQMNMQTDPSGAYSPRHVVCDATNPDNCASVIGGALSVSNTVTQTLPSALNATIYQATPANLNATVYQSTGTNLHMVCDAGCAGSGSVADGTTFTPGTSVELPAGGFYQTTATNNPLANGQTGTFQVTAQRAMFSNLRNASGTEIGTAAVPVQVSIANSGANATPLVTTATLNQAGSALSATNGLYSNLLQSNAVISSGNPLFSQIVAGSANIGTVNNVSTNNAATLPHICGSHVFRHITTISDTQLVAASGSANIYVCDYALSFNGTTNVFLEKATSGTCATTTQIDNAWFGVINSGKIAANPYYQGLNTGASAQLCINNSAAATVDVSLNYDQY